MAYITNTKLSLENITSTNIPSTDALPIDLKKLKGNTTQDGTPTPDNPVSIETVTGRQVVSVVGKNLFGGFTYTKTRNGITFTYNENGTIEAIGTASAQALSMFTSEATPYLITLSSGTYTISGGLSNVLVEVLNSSGTNLVATTSTQFSKSFILTGTTQVFVRLNVPIGTNISNGVVVNVMLEKNSTATTYEEYIGNTYEINLGKNLLPNNISTTEINGITFTVNSDKSITISGTATADAYLYLIGQDNLLTLQPDTYTRYASSDGNNITGIFIQFRKDNVGGTEIFSGVGVGVKTVTLTETTKVVPRIRVLSGTEITTPITLYPMLIKGVYTTYNLPTYAPYKTPIELCEIEDYQDYIRKSTGKNLLDVLSSTTATTTDGVTNTINNSNGLITVSGTPTSASHNIINKLDFSSSLEIGTYTFSISKTLPSNIRLRVWFEDETYTDIMINKNYLSTTYTSAKKITSWRLWLSGLSTETAINETFYIQFEKNSTATTIEPYGINWYIHKEINKVVLNGSETNWAINGTGTVNYFYRRTFTPLMKTGGLSALSSHYPYVGIYTSNTNQGFYISAPEGSSQIRIRYGAEDTLDNFKTWLSNNNVTIYYVLATPTDTIIEDEELIAQLEALSKAYTIRPTTNIVQTSNIPFYIDLDVYSGENTYRDVIYSQEDVNSCKLYFNNVELQDADNYLEKITFTKRVLPENGKKIFTLDNFIAEEVEIIIHDIDTSIIQDKVRIELGTLVNNTYEYVPMGVYNIQDIPTRNDNKITIKLRDNACLFDFNYNAKPLIDSLGGSATKMQILQDICNQANVNCNVNSFMGDSDFIGIYDNTIKARMYVAYIAEQAGCIAKIDRYGNLIFIPLNNLYTHRIPLNIVSKYVKGTPFKIERVVYELGTIKFETSNDETLQTLYISSANPYISVQNDIDRIFEIVENFELDSVEIQKEIIGNPAIDGYDLIEIYDDEDITKPVLFKTLANNTLIYNGKFKSKYKTEIGLEERTENVSKNSNERFKKTIKNEIDLVNGKITQTVEEISTLDDTINGLPTYVITTDTTFQADKPYYKLADNDYVLLVEGTDYQDGDAITSVGYDVYDVIYVDSMMDTVNNSIQGQINDAMQIIQRTLLEQTSEKFTMWFEQTGVKKDLQDLQDLTDENKDNIEIMKAYIDYGTVPLGEPYAGSPYILLGKENSQTKLKILDNRIQFLSSGEETAYISNNTLYINESTILTKQVIGNNNGQWITDVDSQGNLNTYWGG